MSQKNIVYVTKFIFTCDEFCFPVLISCQRIDAGAEQQAAVIVGGKRNHPVLHPAVFYAGIFYSKVVAEHIIAIVLGSRVAGDVAKEGNLLCMASAEIVVMATVEDEVLVKRRQLYRTYNDATII